ncbi:MAG: carbohydrate-binding domain-containing protein [Sphaerochaetaceae bacterium]|nr:carbohydrate-binding domain-containing protein [Sphaerochaetaceae bacterium]
MKRIVSIVLIVLVFLSSAVLWAGGSKEEAVTQSVTEAAATDEFTVVLTSGDESSFSASYNEDGNYELTYTGTEEAVFTVSGLLEGTLIVKSDNADYTIVLDNADIRGQNLPAIQLKSETVCTLTLADGSENYICDSSSNEKKGVVTGSGDVTIEGTGSLTVEVYKKHGIKTDGGLTINSGNVTINGDEAAEGNMISADVFFVMNDGTLTIRANGNVYGEESKGIKVNGVEGEDRDCGYVEINGGTIDIVSVGKAITAGWEAEEDAETTDTSDDPYAAVYINGGNITITTTGTPYEVSEDESLSPEGIEGKDAVIINGGTLYINTTDDSINAGSLVQFNGGYVYANATANDTIDSNGKLEINGGTVIVLNSTNMEQGIDCDNDSNFSYTGGTFVVIGTGNNVPGSSDTTAYSLGYIGTTFKSGDEIAVLDNNSNVVMGFVVPDGITFTTIVFGSESIQGNSSYTIATGTFSAADEKDSLVTSAEGFSTSKSLITYTTTSYTSANGTLGMNVGGGMGAQGGFPGGQAPTGQVSGFMVFFGPRY